MQSRAFSRRDDAVIGSFDHGHAIIEAKQSPQTIALSKDRSLIGQFADKPEALFQSLLEISSLLHERLHYIDTFGTVAGLSMFTARTQAMHRFVDACGAIMKAKAVWQLPLSRWVSSGQAPDAARRLLRLARAFRAGTDAFLAPFAQYAAEGHTTQAWIDVPFPSQDEEGNQIFAKTRAFPMSVGFASADADTQRPYTIVMPLGYESIVEGKAHGAARSLVGSLFPDLPASVLAHYGPPKTFLAGALNENPDAVARQYEIYTATDLMISKYMRAKGFPTFSRNLVFGLSDLALSTSFFFVDDVADHTTKVEIRNPGDMLIHALTQCDPAELAQGQIAYPKELVAFYQNYHDKLASQGDWDAVEPRTLATAHRMWESFTAQNIVVPLLKKRIESAGAIFNDASELMNYAMSLDLPRVEVINDKVRFHGMPEEVRSFWGTQVFTGEIAHQVFSDEQMLRCPRAHRLLPGMSRMDFSGGNCAKHTKLGCGTFVPGQHGYLPSCHFSTVLKSLGFIPIRPA